MSYHTNAIDIHVNVILVYNSFCSEIEAVLNELQDKPAAPRGGHGYVK